MTLKCTDSHSAFFRLSGISGISIPFHIAVRRPRRSAPLCVAPVAGGHSTPFCVVLCHSMPLRAAAGNPCRWALLGVTPCRPVPLNVAPCRSASFHALRAVHSTLRTPSHSMSPHVTVRHWVMLRVLRDAAWCSMALHGTPWHSVALRGTSWTPWHCVAPRALRDTP